MLSLSDKGSQKIQKFLYSQNLLFVYERLRLTGLLINVRVTSTERWCVQ